MRFKETLDNLTAMAKVMPNAMAATSARPRAAAKADALVQDLIAILTKEDSNAVRIALLCNKLITKYKGRAV